MPENEKTSPSVPSRQPGETLAEQLKRAIKESAEKTESESSESEKPAGKQLGELKDQTAEEASKKDSGSSKVQEKMKQLREADERLKKAQQKLEDSQRQSEAARTIAAEQIEQQDALRKIEAGTVRSLMLFQMQERNDTSRARDLMTNDIVPSMKKLNAQIQENPADSRLQEFRRIYGIFSSLYTENLENNNFPKDPAKLENIASAIVGMKEVLDLSQVYAEHMKDDQAQELTSLDIWKKIERVLPVGAQENYFKKNVLSSDTNLSEWKTWMAGRAKTAIDEFMKRVVPAAKQFPNDERLQTLVAFCQTQAGQRYGRTLEGKHFKKDTASMAEAEDAIGWLEIGIRDFDNYVATNQEIVAFLNSTSPAKKEAPQTDVAQVPKSTQDPAVAQQSLPSLKEQLNAVEKKESAPTQKSAPAQQPRPVTQEKAPVQPARRATEKPRRISYPPELAKKYFDSIKASLDLYASTVQKDREAFGSDARWQAYDQECQQRIQEYWEITRGKSLPMDSVGNANMNAAIAALNIALEAYRNERPKFKAAEEKRYATAPQLEANISTIRSFDWRETMKTLNARRGDIVAQAAEKGFATSDLYKKYEETYKNYVKIYKEYDDPLDEKMLRTIVWELQEITNAYEQEFKALAEPTAKKPESGLFSLDTLSAFGKNASVQSAFLQTAFKPGMSPVEIREKLLTLAKNQPFSSLNKEQLKALLYLKTYLPDIAGFDGKSEAGVRLNRNDIDALSDSIAENLLERPRDLYVLIQEQVVAEGKTLTEEELLGLRYVLGLLTDQENADMQAQFARLRAAPAQLAAGEQQLAEGQRELQKGYRWMRPLRSIIAGLAGRNVAQEVADGEKRRDQGLLQLEAGRQQYMEGLEKKQRLDSEAVALPGKVRTQVQEMIDRDFDAQHLKGPDGTRDATKRSVTREQIQELKKQLAVINTIGSESQAEIGKIVGDRTLTPYMRDALSLNSVEWMLRSYNTPVDTEKRFYGLPPETQIWISPVEKIERPLIAESVQDQKNNMPADVEDPFEVQSPKSVEVVQPEPEWRKMARSSFYLLGQIYKSPAYVAQNNLGAMTEFNARMNENRTTYMQLLESNASDRQIDAFVTEWTYWINVNAVRFGAIDKKNAPSWFTSAVVAFEAVERIRETEGYKKAKSEKTQEYESFKTNLNAFIDVYEGVRPSKDHVTMESLVNGLQTTIAQAETNFSVGKMAAVAALPSKRMSVAAAPVNTQEPLAGSVLSEPVQIQPRADAATKSVDAKPLPVSQPDVSKKSVQEKVAVPEWHEQAKKLFAFRDTILRSKQFAYQRDRQSGSFAAFITQDTALTEAYKEAAKSTSFNPQILSAWNTILQRYERIFALNAQPESLSADKLTLGNVKDAKNEETFFRYLRSGQPVIAEFGANWCGPCQKMKPYFEKIAKKSLVLSVDLSVEDGPMARLATEYSVKNLPTTILFVHGQEVSRHVGFKEEKDARGKTVQPKFLSDMQSMGQKLKVSSAEEKPKS